MPNELGHELLSPNQTGCERRNQYLFKYFWKKKDFVFLLNNKKDMENQVIRA